MDIQRESIDFDVLFVGGGPASLAGAIRLMQLAGEKGLELEVALIEKGFNIGAHAVSGAVLNPVALAELVPDYPDRGCPVETVVEKDAFYFLTPSKAFALPLAPRQMRNHGLNVISLSKFSGWLGEMAEEMGVNIFPGFAGKTVLFAEDGRTITGVRTGDQGLDKDGQPKPNFEPGIDLMAKVTVFGEGARGSLTREIDERLGLYDGKMSPVYETGIKEVIELPDPNYFSDNPVNDIHLMGYPLAHDMAGGGFIYKMAANRISIGFLTGLGYRHPEIDPYEEFLKFKAHPFIAAIIRGGKVVEQGARTVSAGGLYSMPELAVDGAMFIGGGASFQNMPALKGVHLAMKSGMLAAEAIIAAYENDDFGKTSLATYTDAVKQSWIWTEMMEGRNFTQALAKPALLKLLYLGAQYVDKGRGLRDPMPLEEDCVTLLPLEKCSGSIEKFDAKNLDGELFIDKLTGVYLSKTAHREDQPNHIIVHDTDLCVQTCYETYGSPCTRFCPGEVYEIVEDEAGARRLKLNPSNCFHCKTCDIKDPYGNITWTCPDGGDGPGYKIV